MLDVGTDRRELLDDPLYLGNQQATRGARGSYDAFIEVVREHRDCPVHPAHCCTGRISDASNARRILERYHDQSAHLQR